MRESGRGSGNGKKGKTMECRDIPVETLEQDEFGIEKYVRALCDFIRGCDTPITIALQGEWGSGKSSFMKMLENCLCGEEVLRKERYEAIWLNTWELFLENDYEQAVQKLIFSLLTQMGEHFDSLAQKQNAENRKAMLQQCLKTFSGIALNVANVASDHYEELLDKVFGGEGQATGIHRAKMEFETFLTNAIEEKYNGVTDQAFLIFVDDLDRLEPKMAVTLLEALKNLFDIRKCIFILAIDYDIVASGIAQKYGNSIMKNRNIEQDFFDKLIQVPYVIPMARYQIAPMVLQRLRMMHFFDREYNYTKYANLLETIVRLATNKNPRAIKRLMNMMQLMLSMDRPGQSHGPDFRAMELLLMAMQLSFPRVYDMICQNSNLDLWQKSFHVGDGQVLEHVRQQYRLDETWKEIIYLTVSKDEVIRQNYYRITELLELYERIQGRCQKKGELVENALGIVNVISRRTVEEVEVRYDGLAYDRSSQTQQRQGNHLIDSIDFSGFGHVLDVGCGSGKTTLQMWERNLDMQVTAFDISESQILTAQVNYEKFRQEKLPADCGGSVSFLVKNVLDMESKNVYDLIFSNAVMHWVPEPARAYRLLYEALVPGGELAVHQGGFGTYAGLHEAARRAITRTGLTDVFRNWIFPVFYPAKEEMEELLEQTGFVDIEVESVSKDESDNENLVDNFANASLIYYKQAGLEDEDYERLKEEFFLICRTEPVELASHRLYIHAFRPK